MHIAIDDALTHATPSRRVKLMCGTWNAAGKVLPKSAVREWVLAAEEMWGEGGAELYVLGLQEAVELDAKSLMSDAGSQVNSQPQTPNPQLKPRSRHVRWVNPEPRAPNPEPRTPNPEPRTPNPEPRTPNPEPRTPQPTT
jgi:hypothetical protein